MATRLAFLVSGGGSLMEHALDAGVPAELVIADRECRGLEIARERGIPTLLLDLEHYGVKPMVFDENRNNFSRVIAIALNEHGIDLVSMAGWETILTAPYFDTFKGLTINNHPALVPAFKGSAHAVRDAFRMGVKVSGYTIHVATEDVDNGEFLEQEALRVSPGETEEAYQERLKVLERRGLVRVLRKQMNLPLEALYCYRCALPMVPAQSEFACPSCGFVGTAL